MARRQLTKRLLYRPLRLAVLISSAVLFAAVGLLVGTAWRSASRLEPLHAHIAHLNRIQQTSLDLEEDLAARLQPRDGLQSDRSWELLRQLDVLMTQGSYLAPTTARTLGEVRELMSQVTGANPAASLLPALERLRRVLAAESGAHEVLIDEVAQDTRLEVLTSMIVVIVLATVGFLSYLLLRRQIFQPMENLGELMASLGQRDFRSVETEDAAPLMKPLLDNYNALVCRLSALEEEHRERQQNLEQRVRSATGALLGQQRNLARAERLAAVGEVAAGVAHELRNPLAGVELALTNLKREVADEEQVRRLEQISHEVKRTVRLLNELLSRAQNAPESARDLDLSRTITELVGLVRYQLPEQVEVVANVPECLRCRLPEDGLRQALLNLVLNAAQAMENGPGIISVDAAARDGRIEIAVSDTGPGFAPELLAAGVRPFVSRRAAGTGLGLAMVQRFARDLGGELHLANQEPNGAVVSIAVPCRT